MLAFLVLASFIIVSTTGVPIDPPTGAFPAQYSIYEINKQIEEERKALHRDVVCDNMTLCTHNCPKLLGHAVDENGCDVCEECNVGSKPLESDILLSENNFKAVLREYGQNTDEFTLEGRGAATSDYNWPKVGEFVTIGYTFEGVSDEKQTRIEEAIELYATHTCIRFVPRTGQAHYINFVGYDTNGCSSYIGLIESGGQSVNIGRNCHINLGTILHELMHALGFWHEQSRGDRDDFVDVHLENVDTDATRNFEKRTISSWDSLGSSYDLSSVMHYGGTFFSVNGMPTITEKGRSEAVLAQRDYFSTEDLWQINTKYQCTEYLNMVPITTQRTNIPEEDCRDFIATCPQAARQGICQIVGSIYGMYCTLSCTNCDDPIQTSTTAAATSSTTESTTPMSTESTTDPNIELTTMPLTESSTMSTRPKTIAETEASTGHTSRVSSGTSHISTEATLNPVQTSSTSASPSSVEQTTESSSIQSTTNLEMLSRNESTTASTAASTNASVMGIPYMLLGFHILFCFFF